MGLYDEAQKPVYVGKVGTGFTEEMLRLLMDKFEKIVTDEAPFKPESGDVVTWLKPQLVCEIAYQVVTNDGRLRMARFKRLRDDKPPEQCTIDQLTQVQPKTETPVQTPNPNILSMKNLNYPSTLLNETSKNPRPAGTAETRNP